MSLAGASGSPGHPPRRSSLKASNLQGQQSGGSGGDNSSEGPASISASSSRRSIKFADDEVSALDEANSGDGGSLRGAVAQDAMEGGVGAVLQGSRPLDAGLEAGVVPGSASNRDGLVAAATGGRAAVCGEAADAGVAAADAAASAPATASTAGHEQTPSALLPSSPGVDATGDVPTTEELSQLLVECGFVPLIGPPSSTPGETQLGAAGGGAAGEVPVRHALASVLAQYRQRAALLSQLLAERREAQRGAARGAGEVTKAEQERDAAVREAQRAKVGG